MNYVNDIHYVPIARLFVDEDMLDPSRAMININTSTAII